MFLEKLIIFILFLCPLVFFHELGHFLMARLFGVRVETFSIGFGPKLFKKKFGDTEYAFSLIPLGGYVKMFGDDPLNKDDVPEEERQYSFTHKGKWARFWIVFGGPLANFIMAFALFFGLLFFGERVPEVKFGKLESSSVFYKKGVRTGDVLIKVNGSHVSSPTDIDVDESTSIQTITVKRHEGDKQVNIGMNSLVFLEEFMKLSPALRKPVVVEKETGKKVILSTKKDSINWDLSLDEIFNVIEENNGELELFKFYPKGELSEIAPTEFEKSHGSIKISNGENFYDVLVENNLFPLDMVVKSVNIKSPADKAGVRPGDIISMLGTTRVMSFEELKNALQLVKTKDVKLKIFRNSQPLEMTLTPDVIQEGQHSKKLIGVYTSAIYNAMKLVESNGKGFFTSIVKGIERTFVAGVKIFSGIKKLITNEVSLKNVGGPLMIAKVASDSFNMSVSYFLQIMAMLSINLGIINLFPIPVLDGGHIMFIVLEIVNRGPLSRRKMEIAQQFGLCLLLLLTFVALFNDFTRFFSS